MTAISEAVILTAGQGSRLRYSNESFLKPFVPVLGRPLISYALDILASLGIERILFVVGYESERTITQLERLMPDGVAASFVKNRDWQKQNGLSALAAAGHVGAPFVLAMGDHLFDARTASRLLQDFDPDLLNVAVDRKLDSIFDLADAMKVQTRDNAIHEIGKDLRNYDAIDVGLFVCPVEVFDYLGQAKQENSRNDCSLADGVRLMAADNKVRAVDIGDGWWQDVDTLGMLSHAEQKMSAPVTS